MDMSTTGAGDAAPTAATSPVEPPSASVPRPFVIVSECPWPSRNGVTAKTASLLDAWDVQPLVLCPEHSFGLREQHRDARSDRRTRRRPSYVSPAWFPRPFAGGGSCSRASSGRGS